MNQETADDFASEAQAPEFAEKHESNVGGIAPDVAQIANSNEACIIPQSRGPILSSPVFHFGQ
jgi:hypothetical protein